VTPEQWASARPIAAAAAATAAAATPFPQWVRR